MRNYFTFGTVTSSTYKCYISGSGTYNAPEREYELIDVPGRDGALVGLEKRFMNVNVTYPAFIFNNFDTNMAGLRSALLSQIGYQELSDTYHADEFRKALFTGDIEVDVDHLRAGEFELTFNCKPQRYLVSGKTKTTITSASGSLNNPTMFDSKPLITVFGYGDMFVNGHKITIANVYDSVSIDSEMGDCYSGAYNANHAVTFATNNFPVLEPGNNSFTRGANITKIEITPHWWRV